MIECGRRLWLDLDPETYDDLNDAPLENWGETLEDMASSRPITAYDLLHRMIADAADLEEEQASFRVQTEQGRISTKLDKEAGRGAFLKSIENNLAGGAVLHPAEVIVSIMVEECDFLTREPVGEPRLEECFAISVEPTML